MANVKTFTVAGVSTLNGTAKVRFSNNVAERTKMLAYTGHTDITLIDLGSEMTKLAAASFLATADEMQGETEQAAIAAYLEKNVPSEPKPRGRPVKLPTLADVPNRANGKFIAKAVREEMLEQLIADTIAEKEAAAAKRKARAEAKAAEAETA